MIDPSVLQQDLLAYLQTTVALPVVNWRGSDNTAAIVLPMLVVHIADVQEEWEDSGVYRCFVVLQLHTNGNAENGQIAAARLKPILTAMEDEESVAAALEAHFTMSALIFKGTPLHHKDSQLIHAARYEMLLSENTEVPE